MIEKNVCYIVGAGDFDESREAFLESDYIIACDGGYEYLEKIGIKPDLIIGDFDSASAVPTGDNIIKLNPIKNDTDTFHALMTGLEMGYKEFKIFGGTGGRISHTLANIQALSYLTKLGAKGYLIDRTSVITAITNDIFSFGSDMKGYISVFSNGGISEGITINGLKYELEDGTLDCDFSLGVSNEFIGKSGSISVKSGTLIIVYERQK